MQSKGMPLIAVEKVSRLIDVLRDFAFRDGRASFEESTFATYEGPCLSLWGAGEWFELAEDWEVVDFLLSGEKEARRLMSSLQALLQWYGQQAIDEIQKRLRPVSIIN